MGPYLAPAKGALRRAVRNTVERPHNSLALVPFETLAVFLDFDGTLTEIVDRPEDVGWGERHTRALNSVVRATGGATAVVSGRGLRDLETLLDGFEGVLCGGHGAEMQGSTGASVPEGLDVLLARAKDDSAGLDGVWIEEKAAGFTMHYRARPEAGQAVKSVLEAILKDREDLHLFPAKMAWEVRPSAHSKGGAIAQLMEQSAFAGKRPVFAGDDTTDFAAFPDVQAMGGLTIAVGNAEVDADFHVSDPRYIRRWLFGEEGPWDV